MKAVGAATRRLTDDSYFKDFLRLLISNQNTPNLNEVSENKKAGEDDDSSFGPTENPLEELVNYLEIGSNDNDLTRASTIASIATLISSSQRKDLCETFVEDICKDFYYDSFSDPEIITKRKIYLGITLPELKRRNIIDYQSSEIRKLKKDSFLQADYSFKNSVPLYGQSKRPI